MTRKLKPQSRITVAKKQSPRWQRERNISLLIWIIIPLIIVSALGLVGYWGYDTYVAPNHRKQGIASALVIGVIGTLKERGFCRVFGHIPEWNVASRGLYESCGFAPRRRISFTRLLGISVIRPHPRTLWA